MEERQQIVHEVRCQWRWFERLLAGDKTSEVRFNDRDYQAGDLLRVLAIDRSGSSLTGQSVTYLITHVLGSDAFPEALHPGYVVLSLRWLS